MRRGDQIRQADERRIFRRLLARRYREPRRRACPIFRASASAASSINSPRAQLIKRAPFFILAMAAALIIFSVEGLSEVCSETKSDCASKSIERDKLHFDFARSGGRNVRIVGEHFHFQGAGAARDFACRRGRGPPDRASCRAVPCRKKRIFPICRQ